MNDENNATSGEEKSKSEVKPRNEDTVKGEEAGVSQDHLLIAFLNFLVANGVTKKTLIYVSVAACFILIAVVVFLAVLKPNKITIGDSTLTFFSQDYVIKTVLPSNLIWLDTQIDIEPETSVSVSADGRVHLAIHYVVDSAFKDSVVKYPWSDPSGQFNGSKKPVHVPGDPTRDGQKLCPSANYGRLIAYVGPEKLGKENPWPEGQIQVLGSDGVIRNDSKEPQRLWLSVNDTALDETDYSEQAYLLNEDACDLAKRYGYEEECDLRSLVDAKKNWQKIKRGQYWNLWFDDNVGSYIVKIDMKKSVSASPEYCRLNRKAFTETYNKSKSFQVSYIDEEYATYDMNDVRDKALRLAAKNGDENNVLILFDIDNTILAMNGDLGSDQWYSWQDELDEDDKDKIHYLLDAQKLLFQVKSMRTTQGDISKIVHELNASGYQTAALTARGEDMRLVTFRELRRNGIRFKNAFFDGHDKRVEFVPLLTGKRRPVSFQDGVILAAGQDKGKVFAEILDRTKNSGIKSIIFVDDKIYNIDNFRASFQVLSPNQALDLITFHYKGEEEVVKEFSGKDTMTEWCSLEKLFRGMPVAGGLYSLVSRRFDTVACR